MHSVVNDGVSPSVFSYMENKFNILCVDVCKTCVDGLQKNEYIYNATVYV